MDPTTAALEKEHEAVSLCRPTSFSKYAALKVYISHFLFVMTSTTYYNSAANVI